MVTYSSSDPLALSVDSVTGVLSALVLGTVTITAVEHDGAGKVFGSVSYTVTVTPNTLVPAVNVTAINGSLSVGSTLTGVYTFTSNGGEPTDKSTMVWLNGGHTETDNTYLLDGADVGSVLTFQVTAQNGAGIIGNTSSMNTASSIDTQIPVVIIQDQAGNTLSGVPLVGDVLTAMVVCATSCSASSFNYQWEEETAPNSGVYVDVAGATAQTFTMQPHYQLKRIRVTADSKK